MLYKLKCYAFETGKFFLRYGDTFIKNELISPPVKPYFFFFFLP